MFFELEMENIGPNEMLLGTLPRAVLSKIKTSSVKQNLKSWSETFPEPTNIYEWGQISLWNNMMFRHPDNNKYLFFKSLFSNGFQTVKDLLTREGFIDPSSQNLNRDQKRCLEITINSVRTKINESLAQ